MERDKTLAETTTFSYDGYTYTISHMPARAGLRAGAKLLAAAGPGLEGLGGGMLAAAGSLVQNPALGDTVVSLADDFAGQTQVTNDATGNTVPLAACFDAHFAGRYGALLKWLSYAIEWDLDSFLGEVRGQFAGAIERLTAELAASKSKSQKDADTNGRSGK